MIHAVFTGAWRRYHSSSPYDNLILSRHPGLRVHLVENDYECRTVARGRIDGAEALLLDPLTAPMFVDMTHLPKILLTNDKHYHSFVGAKNDDEIFQSVDCILTPYLFAQPRRDLYYYASSRHGGKLAFYPQCAPDIIRAPLVQLRSPSVVVSGNTNPEVYPLRDRFLRTVKESLVLPYGGVLQKNKDTYFSALSTYSFAMTCHSVLQYTVAKYYEIPFAGCVLIAPRPASEVERHLLGFVPGVNFLEIPSNPQHLHATTVAEICLANGVDPDKHREIAIQGQRLVFEKHTAWARINYLEKLAHLLKLGLFSTAASLDSFHEAKDTSQVGCY